MLEQIKPSLIVAARRHAVALHFSLDGFAPGWATFNATEIKIAGNRDIADRRQRPAMLSK